MPHRETGVAPPDVRNRRAPTVVRSIHAEEVALTEAGLHGLHPVPPILVRSAGKRPERRLQGGFAGQDVVGDRPADHAERRSGVVPEAHAKQREPRMPLVERHHQGLLDAIGRPGSHGMPYTLAEPVTERRARLAADPQHR